MLYWLQVAEVKQTNLSSSIDNFIELLSVFRLSNTDLSLSLSIPDYYRLPKVIPSSLSDKISLPFHFLILGICYNGEENGTGRGFQSAIHLSIHRMGKY